MLPELFLSRMQAQLGEEYEAYLKSLERPRAVALRFNPLKGAAPTLPFVAERVSWEPQGYYYDPNSRPGLHPCIHRRSHEGRNPPSPYPC